MGNHCLFQKTDIFPGLGDQMQKIGEILCNTLTITKEKELNIRILLEDTVFINQFEKVLF